jgi:nitroimidazol reductase NimA-like FMN-containing flavoprotein (pyridoxamine 5'-phosphate oxidase superfamily)
MIGAEISMNHPESPRPMRRAESEITAPAQLEKILTQARVLFLSLRDAQAPYVVPVCFGWEKDTLYVHSALTGAKIDLIRADPSVGFSACTEITLTPGATACNFSLQAESIAGTGRARILADDKERTRGLDLIMRHYSEGDSIEAPVYGVPAERVSPYGIGPLSRTCVIAITILTLRGRRLGKPAPYGSTRSAGTP